MIMRFQLGRLGPLTLLALMLASAGAMRLGQGVGAAMALQSQEPGEDSTAPLSCPSPPERLLEAMSAREKRLKAREVSLNDRMAALRLSEKAIDARLVELTAAEKSLKETIAIVDGAAEQDLARLTTVYEAMKPAEAAALFSAMTPEFAAGFLGRMKPESAALVLSGMQPDAAYAISVLVAGRNALAPKN